MNIKYLIRLDDACPQMNFSKWDKIEEILDKYDIKPLIGIIPYNEDKDTIYQKANPSFWSQAQKWNEKEWSIALHGYNHVYTSTDPGINPVNKRSEFSGLDYSIQCDKLRKGMDVFLSHNLKPNFFFPPSHTFDLNTLRALKEVTSIRIVCDTFAMKPYLYEDIIFIPQQMGRFRSVKLPGFWTFCFHPNTMSDVEMFKFEDFIKQNRRYFMSFHELSLENLKSKSTIDRFFSYLYFKKRILNSIIKL